MRHFLRSGVLSAALTVVLARVGAAFWAEWQRLSGSGELAQRLDRRRRRHLVRVAVAAGVAPSPDPAARTQLHAAVHVGSITPGDVDDMGLLEAAMRARRATLEAPTSTDRGLHDAVFELESTAERAREYAATKAPVWAVVVASIGLVTTFVPLVRPLDAAAPWFVVAGLALTIAGWVGARR